MPFDELVEDQDDEAMPRRFGYPPADDEDGESKPSIGMRIMQIAPTPGLLGEQEPLLGSDVQRQSASDGDSQVEPRPSIGQQIVQIGKQGVPPFDIQDGRPVWRTDPQNLMKPNIGQRIMRGPSTRMAQSGPLLNLKTAAMSFNVSPEQQGVFSSFMPFGAMPSASGYEGNQTPQLQSQDSESRALGRSAGEILGAASAGGVGAERTISTPSSSGTQMPVVDVTNQVKARSRIPRPAAVPNINPDLSSGLKPQKQRQVLSGLMRGITRQPRPLPSQDPIGVNVDPAIVGHELPDNAGQELKDLLKQWQTVPTPYQTKLAELMGRDMNAANEYAKELLAGKPSPSGPGGSQISPYAGADVDNLVHSPAWTDGRITQDERNALTELIKTHNYEGANRYAKGLQDAVQHGERTLPPPGPTTDPKELAARTRKAAEIARRYEWNKQWLVEAKKDNFESGKDKCNQFVFDVLREAGLEVPGIGGRLGYIHLGGPPAAAQWADSSTQRVGHWQIVNGPPQPGDVIAELTGGRAHPNWAHVGVVVEPGRTASASTLVYPKGMITVNDWGFRKDDVGKVVVRRYIP